MIRHDLLSDEEWVVGCLHLEGAVLSPQVDRIGDASNASFVDLGSTLLALRWTHGALDEVAHHLCRFWAGDVELHIGVLFPVSEQEGKLEQETIVGISKCRKCLGARVSVEAAFEPLARLNQVLPVLKAVGVFLLEIECQRICLGGP